MASERVKEGLWFVVEERERRLHASTLPARDTQDLAGDALIKSVETQRTSMLSASAEYRAALAEYEAACKEETK